MCCSSNHYRTCWLTMAHHGIPSRHARLYLPTHSSYCLQSATHRGLTGIYLTEILTIIDGVRYEYEWLTRELMCKY